MQCARCGTVPEPGEFFCGECGQTLTPAPPSPHGAAQPAHFAPPQGSGGSRAARGLCGVLVLLTGLALVAVCGLGVWLWYGGGLGGLTAGGKQMSNTRIKLENTNLTRITQPTPPGQNTNRDVSGEGGGDTGRGKGNGNSNAGDAGRNQGDGSSPPGWEKRYDRASLNGQRLTYYQGSTSEQCQADCAKNPGCKGFTFIRSGAYNSSDPPMCYLLSAVADAVPHDCCISGVKNDQ